MPAFINTLSAFTVAFVCGAAIGLERQWRQRNAGLRTNVLVALGAAAFSDLGMRLLGADGGTRIIAYVVSGIGFLGAGVILKDGATIRGLNTAATLWCSAAVGAFSGALMPAEAAVLTCFVLAGNTLLRPAVNWINRRPVAAAETEAEYIIHVVCCQEHVALVRDLLDETLTHANYPVSDVKIASVGEDQLELDASLIPASADAAELDAVVNALEASPHVKSATWSVETIL